MNHASIRRLGLLLIAAAIVAAVVAPRILRSSDPAVRPGERIYRPLAVVGVVLVALSFLAGVGSGGGARCPRCQRPAMKGSIFCAAHRQELTRTASEMRAHRDNRSW
jgi:hypothetical protein